MKIIFFGMCFILTSVSISFSQISIENNSKKIQDVRILALKKLSKYIKNDILFSKQKNTAFLLTLGLSIDSGGNIDDVLFSATEPKVVIKSVQLTKDFKEIPFKKFDYKNQILILPILFIRPEDDKISNLKEFLNNFSSLWPVIEPNNTRKILLLEPLINNFFDPID
ncbi:hypothetical protein QWY86_06885 [Pedobacter aquatilis]|uniref:hypothetical protein n=1 Tax=Pedobacter aquatilis TaxID=351343 RepID=UPI0025B4420E|nr:hypothetical protein [Pedobacter aquatilis]MDN3586380.1 hypothetical protein [Pedobacter aquatilis]